MGSLYKGAGSARERVRRPISCELPDFQKGVKMTLEEFMKLETPDQEAFLTAEEDQAAQINDLTAERDSLHNDNIQLTDDNRKLTAENTRIKATNYSLTRQLKTREADAPKDAETIIHDMFKRG